MAGIQFDTHKAEGTVGPSEIFSSATNVRAQRGMRIQEKDLALRQKSQADQTSLAKEGMARADMRALLGEAGATARQKKSLKSYEQVSSKQLQAAERRWNADYQQREAFHEDEMGAAQRQGMVSMIRDVVRYAHETALSRQAQKATAERSFTGNLMDLFGKIVTKGSGTSSTPVAKLLFQISTKGKSDLLWMDDAQAVNEAQSYGYRGRDPKEAKAFLNSVYSRTQQEAVRRLNQTNGMERGQVRGLIQMLRAAAGDNPSQKQLVESLIPAIIGSNGVPSQGGQTNLAPPPAPSLPPGYGSPSKNGIQQQNPGGTDLPGNW